MAERAAELYRVYGEATGFKNFQGNPMPDWADLPPTIQEAWRAVASEKASADLSDYTPDEFAIIDRAKQYRHFSMEHRQNRALYLLIARLAEALGL